MKRREIIAWIMLAALVAVVVVWVRWAQHAIQVVPPLTRIPVASPSVISVPQQIANAVSEAEAKQGVTAGTKFTITIKVLTANHSEGVITTVRGNQNYTADLVNGNWVATLQ